MKSRVMEHIDKISQYNNNNLSNNILLEYAIVNIQNYAVGNTSGENIVEILAYMDYYFTKENIDKNFIMKVINKIFIVVPFSNQWLITHISNFFEIILINHSSIINYYILAVDKYSDVIDKDYSAILYKAVILSALKNDLNMDIILNKIKYPWRSYFEAANCSLYSNNKLKALRYINKAINKCPKDLSLEYSKRKKQILKINAHLL